MRKILISLGMIVFVGAIAVGATGAFFSDSETSTGNTFAAGSIDLKVDNTSYVTSTTTGQLVASPNTSWDLRDLTVEKFFNFFDVKPGDEGEDTISLHVNNNDSWLCADVKLTSNKENDLVGPEVKDNDTSIDDGSNNQNGGELAQQINFIWWADDGDNVLESNETVLPGGPLGALSVGQSATVALADSQTNIWNGSGPLPGGSTRYIAKGWCFGTITPNAVPQDNATTSGPLDGRGTGFTCNGVDVNNTAQTDSLTADVSFRAEQSRNNGSFVCTPPEVAPNN